MITLTASAAYGYGGKQFVARITGRDPKFTFRREFIGRRGGKRDESTSADVDEPGLYETRDIDRKGGADDTYYVAQEIDGSLRRSIAVEKEDAMKIARALGAGCDLDTVVYLEERPSRRDPSRMVWGYHLITPRQAEARAVAQTLDTAVEACWTILQSLPEKEAKKVLAQLRQRVSPPKAVAASLAEDTPAGIVADAAQDADVPESALGLTPTPVAAFAVGDHVVCLDDSDGAHFLVAGQAYTVRHLQTDSDGLQRVGLEGMARAWEASRFRRA